MIRIVLAIGVPSAARPVLSVSPGWPTGPWVLEMTRGPAAKVSTADSMFSETFVFRSALPCVLVRRPDREDVAVEDGQALVWPKPKVVSWLLLPDDSLSGIGPRLTVAR